MFARFKRNFLHDMYIAENIACIEHQWIFFNAVNTCFRISFLF